MVAAAHPRLITRRFPSAFQREDHIVRGLKPICGPLLEAVANNAIERRREIAARAGERWRIIFQDRIERLDGRLARKCPLSADHLVQHHA
jgi:hypothetical protein